MSGNDSERETRIRDYLDGRMNDDELEVFELELFRNPALLDDLEATRALRRGLREIASQPTVGEVMPPAQPHPQQRVAVYAAAAFLLGAALPGYFLWQRMATPGGALQVVPLQVFRSGPAPAPVTHVIDAKVDRVGIRFTAVLPPDAADFTVELRQGDTVVARETGIVPDEADHFRIDVPASKLGDGDYEARLIARLKAGGERALGPIEFALTR